MKKVGGSIGQRQVFLKEGGWHCSNLMLSRFIIFTFRNYFTLYKIVWCIYRLFWLFVLFCYCVIIFFFCHHNFMKEGNSKLSKNEPENLFWVHFRKQWTTIWNINLGFPNLMIAAVNYCQWWLLIFSYIIWTKA